MNYSYIIHQVLENLQKERHDTNGIKSIKHDIEQTIREMYTDSEAPIKSKSFNIGETEDVSIDSLIMTSANLVETLTDKIYSLSNLNIVANNNSDALPILTDSQFNITITSSTGEEILNEDYDVVADTELDVDEEISVDDIVGATAVVTLNSIDGALNNVTVDLTYTRAFTRLELPSYMYVPFDAQFKVSNVVDGAGYMSKEMTEEQYNRWVPYGGIDDRESNVYILDDGPQATVYTIENLEWDGRIGYFFYVYEDKMFLMYKPASPGTVTIRYSYIPVIDPDEATEVPIHQAFINGIIAGTTYRQLQKMLLGAKDELDLVKIKTLQGQYHNSYKSTVKVFAGYNRKKTKVQSIKMFGIVDDFSMELY